MQQHKLLLENGAEVVATGFGKGLRITERAVKRLSGDIQVYEMDIQNEEQVTQTVNNIKENFGTLDGILACHCIFSNRGNGW